MGSLLAQIVKNPPANAGDLGSIPGSERSPGGGNGNPLQYSCLEHYSLLQGIEYSSLCYMVNPCYLLYMYQCASVNLILPIYPSSPLPPL